MNETTVKRDALGRRPKRIPTFGWGAIGTALAVCACVGLASSAQARWPGGGGRGHSGGPGGGFRGGPPGGGHESMLRPGALEAVAAKLGVDEKTLGKIKDLTHAANRNAIELRAAVERAQLELRHMMETEEPDRSKIMSAVEQVGRAHTKLRKNRVGLLLDVRKLLTREQRAKLPVLLREMRGSRHRKGPPGGFGGPGGPDGPR